jgi:hypothetical protein
MKNILYVFLLIIASVIEGCIPSNTITRVSYVRYNEKGKSTEYMNYPYGSVVIPGKWKEDTYVSSSKQQYLINDDSIKLSVAINPWNKYEFYKPELTEKSYVNEYYEWDSKYISEKLNCERQILLRDTINNSIVWRVYNETNIDNYFLFGLKNKIVYALGIGSGKMSGDQKISLLKATFLKNE